MIASIAFYNQFLWSFVHCTLASSCSGKKRDAPPAAGKEKASTSAEEPKKKRIKVEPHVESEEHYTQKIEVKIKIPDDLKNRLADDWDLISRQNKLVKLPCEYTVERILQEYLTQKISVKGTTISKETAVTELTGGKDKTLFWGLVFYSRLEEFFKKNWTT